MRPAAPESRRWLVISAGLGLVAVLVVGEMNLFEEGLFIRWLILGAGWVGGGLLGYGFWSRVPLPAPAFGRRGLGDRDQSAGRRGDRVLGRGARALDILIAPGTQPPRGPRRAAGCARSIAACPPSACRSPGRRSSASFAGAIAPYWRAEAAIAKARGCPGANTPELRGRPARLRVRQEGRPLQRPALAGRSLPSVSGLAGPRCEAVGPALEDDPDPAAEGGLGPRNPDVWSLHSERAKVTQDLLNKVGPSLSPREIIPLQASVVEATRTASRLYPTNAMLHARLAEASAAISMFQDAASEASEALRLDGLTPHLDKKLPDAVRMKLEGELPGWEEKAGQFKVEVK